MNTHKDKFDVVILSGGLGTRLRSVIGETQKVLTKVNNEEFILKQLKWLASQDIDRVVLALGYKADDVKELIVDQIDNYELNLSIIPSIEKKPLGTGGALRKALQFVDTDIVAVINGDSFVPVALEAVLQKHKQCDATITMVTKKMEDAGRYGIVVFNNLDEVEMFVEKPNILIEQKVNYINAGTYFMQKEEMKKMELDKNISLEKDIFPQYIANRLFVFRTELPFIDIGTPQSLFEAAHFFRSLDDRIEN